MKCGKSGKDFFGLSILFLLMIFKTLCLFSFTEIHFLWLAHSHLRFSAEILLLQKNYS